MSDIRYVILSDMHLGQDRSILTHIVDTPAGQGPHRLVVDAMHTAPPLRHMMDILAEVIGHNQGSEPPVLILLGDILELALAEMHIATMVFQRFASLWQRDGKPLFKKVIYLAGNHDHQLWEYARGGAYADYLAKAPGNGSHQPAHHITGLTHGLPGGDPLIRALVGRALGDHSEAIEVASYYPNLALHARSSDRIAVLHHGHFVEPIYRAMSYLSNMLLPDRQGLPDDVETWEKENCAWIEFFWSSLGREGGVGSDVRRIHDILPDGKKLEALSERIAQALVAGWQPGSWYGKAEKTALNKTLPYLVRFLLAKFERTSTEESSFPGRGLLDGLRHYIDGPLVHQIQQEFDSIPKNITLIFGHTHQPFERIWDAGELGERVELYNTGGWAVDPNPDIQPHMGGAAVLLDEDLNAASLRFFNQAETREEYRVKLHTAAEAGNVLYQRLSPLIDPSAEPYTSFSRAAHESITRRFASVTEGFHGAASQK